MTKRLIFISTIILLFFLIIGCNKKVELPSEKKAEPLVYVTLYTPTPKGLAGVDFPISKSEDTPSGRLKYLVRKKEKVINKKQGLPSRHKPFLPIGTKVLSVKIKKGIATANFSRDVLRVYGNKKMQTHAVAAIVLTLKEFKNIKAVKFQVEGREKGKIKVEGMEEGKLEERNIEKWWGKVTLKEQPWK